MSLNEIIGGGLLILGALLAFIAALGVLRFPDLLARLHAATKPQVLGLMAMSLGLGLILNNLAVAATLLLVVAFQILTGPISAHMLSRAGYRTGLLDGQDLAVDELIEDLERAAGRSETELQLTAQQYSTDLDPALPEPEPGSPEKDG